MGYNLRWTARESTSPAETALSFFTRYTASRTMQPRRDSALPRVETPAAMGFSSHIAAPAIQVFLGRLSEDRSL